LLTGCELVMIGNESGCSRILRILQKGFEKEQVKECFSGMRKEGFLYHAFLLLGERKGTGQYAVHDI
jgi:radical SAM superfamily enzyme YgiQ (UPF0313 family)